MGSLNDYGTKWRELGSEKPRGSWLRRLAAQSLLAAAFFFLIAALIGADSRLGEGARYIAASGVAADNSWINWSSDGSADGQALPVSGAEPDNSSSNAGTNGSDNAGTNTSTNGSESIPVFTAPASGIVVTDLAVAVSGFSTQLGVTISGTAGQQVKATAAGTVAYMGSSEDGYIVELVHDGGFTSVYQGLSELQVGSGDELAAADVIGSTASGKLTFSLLRDGEEVDPLEYLFRAAE